MNEANHKLKVTNPPYMQSEFTALQGAIHDYKNLKQEFKQIRIFKGKLGCPVILISNKSFPQLVSTSAAQI